MNLLGKYINRVSYYFRNARFCEEILWGCELLVLPVYMCLESDSLGLNPGWAPLQPGIVTLGW